MRKEKEVDYSVLNYAPIGIFVMNSDYSVVFWNKCAEAWTGIKRLSIVGNDIRDFFPRFAKVAQKSRIEKIFEGASPGIFTEELSKDLFPSPLPGGGSMVHHTVINSLPRPRGTGYYAFLAFEDVTELASRISRHEELRKVIIPMQEYRKESLAHPGPYMGTYREFLDSVADGIILADMKYRISLCNKSVKTVLGYDRKELLGKAVYSIISDEEKCAEFKELLMEKGLEGHAELDPPLIRENGKKISAHISFSRVVEREGAFSGVVVQIRDISKHVTALDLLQQHATEDGLTGTSNRNGIMKRLKYEFGLAKRYGKTLSLCICDLDSFKQVNDTYGHTTGDDVLVKFVEVIKENLRETDFAGRYGGDEFLIVMPYTNANGALIGLERIRASMAEHTFETKEGATFSATASFGLVEITEGEDDWKSLLEAADKQLYWAKSAGRNKVAVR